MPNPTVALAARRRCRARRGDRGGVGARRDLDLPVDADGADRAAGHGGLGVGEERTQAGEQGDGDGDAGGGGEIVLAAPIVGITSTRTGGGYWLAAADGRIFDFGDAGPIDAPCPGRARSSASRATRCPRQQRGSHKRALARRKQRQRVFRPAPRSTTATRAEAPRRPSASPPRDARLLGRDRTVGAAAAAELGHRSAHRLLEQPTAPVARRGQRCRVAHVSRVGPPRPAERRRAPGVLEGADVTVG